MSGALATVRKTSSASKLPSDRDVLHKRSSSSSIKRNRQNMTHIFNDKMTMLVYDETDLVEDVLRVNKREETELHDPWTPEEENAMKKKRERERDRETDPETTAELEEEEDKDEFQKFLDEWKEAREENDEIEEQDKKCMKALQRMDIPGVGPVLESKKLKRIFQEYRKLELEVRIFKNIKAINTLKVFISKSNVKSVQDFLKIQEDYFQQALTIQKDLGLIGRNVEIPKLHSAARHKIFKSIKFSAGTFKDEWLEASSPRSEEDDVFSLFSEDEGLDIRSSRISQRKKSKRSKGSKSQKLILPFRWQGYIKLFGDLNLEWRKLMRALVENYLKCINTGSVQALMNYDFDFNYARSNDPLALIKVLFERPIPADMLKKPFVPPDLAQQMVPKTPQKQSRNTRATKVVKHVNPLLRVDRYYSRNRQACVRECPFHEGKLFLLLINLGKSRVVKYCLERGFKANMKICGTEVKHMKWIEDFHTDPYCDDNNGIRVSTFEITTPLAAAAELVCYGDADPEIVTTLLKHGAKPLACNDLAIRSCVSSIYRTNNEQTRRRSFSLYAKDGPMIARREITALAYKELNNQWKAALQVWKEKNRNLNQFKQEVAQLKTDVHLKYYFDVAHLSQALLQRQWGAVDTILGFLDEGNPRLSQSMMSLSSKLERASVSSSTSNLSFAVKTWKKEHPDADTVVKVFDGSLSDIPLLKIVSSNKKPITDELKILDYLIENREHRSFSFTENRVLKTLKVLDKFLIAALRTSSKTKANDLQQDANGNSHYIFAILILLETTRIKVDNRRLSYLVALLVKSMTEFKPGDKTAITYMLKNEQIRSFLKLENRVLLCEDVRNVVNIVTDKKLQIVFEVPKVLHRQSVRMSTGNGTGNGTLARAKNAIGVMSRKLSRGRKSLTQNQEKEPSVATATKNTLLRTLRGKKKAQLGGAVQQITAASAAQSIVTANTTTTGVTDNSKASRNSIGPIDEYSTEIEPNLMNDLLVKAATNGFLELIMELKESESVIEVDTYHTMMENAMFSKHENVIHYIYELFTNEFSASDPHRVSEALVKWTKYALEDPICSEIFLNLLETEEISLNSLISFDERATYMSSRNEDATRDKLASTLEKFITESICGLNYINVPKNDKGNIARKKCFKILVSNIKEKKLKFETEERTLLLDNLLEQNEPVWTKGTRMLLDAFIELDAESVSNKWALDFLTKILVMKRPKTFKGRMEMLDLLGFIGQSVPGGKKGDLKIKITSYTKKIEHDITGNGRTRTQRTLL